MAALVAGVVALSDSGTGGGNSPTLVSDIVVRDTRSPPAVISFVLTDPDERDKADVTVSFRPPGTSAWTVIYQLNGLDASSSVEKQWDFAESGIGRYTEGVALSVRTSAGSVTERNGIPLGNDKPVVSLGRDPPCNQNDSIVGLAAIPLRATDSSDDVISILVSYRLESEDDSSWKVVTALNASPEACSDCRGRAFTYEDLLDCVRSAGSDCYAVTGVKAERGGKSLDFIWDVIRDLGNARRSVRLRFVPFDGDVFGEAVEWGPCSVDNNDDPQVEIVPVGGSDRSFEIPIRFLLRDANSDTASVIVQWATEGEAIPELVDLPLEDPAFIERLLTASDEDIATMRRDLHIVSPASIKLRGILEDVDESGERIRSPDFVRAGLVFLPPDGDAARPLPPGPFREGSEVFLIGQEIAFLEKTPEGRWSRAGTSRIMEFDPATSEARLFPRAPRAPRILALDAPAFEVRFPESPPDVHAGSRYELVARHSTHNLMSSKDGILHAVLWDSEPDLSGAGVPLSGRIKLRAVAIDTERGPLSFESPVDLDGSHLVAVVPLEFPDNSSPAGLLLADVNGDGPNEIVAVDGRGLLIFTRLATAEDLAPERPLGDLLVRAVAVGDLGEGRPSLAVAVRIPAGDEIRICRNEGDGVKVLSLGQPLPSGDLKEVTILALGDVTGDGSLDLVAAGDDPPGLSVYLAPDDLRSSPVTIALEKAPTALVLADLDDDGHLEIAAGGGILTSPIPNSLQVFSLDEAGMVSRSSSERPGLGAMALAAGRFGPGPAMRLTAASKTSNLIAIFRLEGEGLVLERELPAVLPAALAPADFNGDGRTDLIVASSSKIAVHLQGDAGLGDIPAYGLSPPAGDTESLATGDLNGDGLSDLISAGISRLGNVVATLYVQSLSGSVRLREPDVLFSTGGVASVGIGDLEADGRNDLLTLDPTGGGRINVHRQTTQGILSLTPGLVTLLEGVAQGARLAVGDLDGDGRNDVAAPSGSGGKIKVFGSGGKVLLDLEGALGPRDLVIGDLTGDGRNDLVTATADAVELHVQNEDGTFARPVDLPVEGQPLALAIADLDGDGGRDVAVLEKSPGSMRLHLQKHGKLVPGPRLDFTGTRLSFSIADLNADGANDIVIALGSEGRVFYGPFQGSAATARSHDLALNAGGNLLSVATGDLNGDGRIDVILGTTSNFRIALYYQDAGAKLGTASVDPGTRLPSEAFGTGSPVSGMVLGDLNGDGKDDIAALFGGDVAVYLAR